MSIHWFDRLSSHPLLLPAQVRSRNGGSQLLKLLAAHQQTERFSPERLASRQQQMLLALARHSASQSRCFAQRLGTAGLTPESLAAPGGLSRLHPLTRRAVVAAGEDLFCRSWPQTHGPASTSTTSGSTGETISVRRTRLCDLHWLAASLREHLWHDREFSGRLAVSRANTPEPATRADWGPPCSMVVRTGPSSVMPITRPVEELIRWLHDFGPTYLLMLPSSLAAIVAYLEQEGRRLPGLRSVRTVSETVSTRLRDDVRRVLGVDIEDVYSSMEGGIIAVQCPEGGGYHISETVLMEIVNENGQPCASDEIGRILITDLINFATPLIRYDTGDYAEMGTPCRCGRGLPTIRRILGRQRNLVLLPDGSKYWPTVGYHRWAERFAVQQFQFVQTDRRTITAKLWLRHRLTPAQEAELTTIIQNSLRHPFEIRYEWWDGPLPRGPGGKFEEFVCHAV